ncbi:adenine phosphoribosyltransferase [Nitratifractor sp.]
MTTLDENGKKMLLESIRTVPDFPKPGIAFKDITTLLNRPQAYRLLMDHLHERYRNTAIDFVAGIESRGFIFGAALADRLGVGFVPIRKKGKLPYTTVSEKYALEYGYDEIEIHIDAFSPEGERPERSPRVLLIDDLLATGGTASAASRLIMKVGAECVECCFVIELEFLKGREKIEAPVYSVLQI